MRKAVSAVLVVASVALASVAGAGQRIDTRVTIHYSPGGKRVAYFYGRVKSPNSQCVEDRKVALYSKDGQVKTKVGQDYTNAAGYWEVEASATEPAYFAKSKSIEVPAGVCEGDHSPILKQT